MSLAGEFMEEEMQRKIKEKDVKFSNRQFAMECAIKLYINNATQLSLIHMAEDIYKWLMGENKDA